MRFRYVLLLALASCVSWNLESVEAHPALRSGVTLATYERGRGAEHERSVGLRSGSSEFVPTSLDALMPYVRPLDNAEAAIAYGDLVRRLPIADSGARGLPIEPDPAVLGPGGGGRYSRTDAEAWGIPFEPSAEPYGGGWAVRRVVLFPPVQNPMHPRVATPWRLVQIREVVFKDGTIRPLEEKTLSDGQDAARFTVH